MIYQKYPVKGLNGMNRREFIMGSLMASRLDEIFTSNPRIYYGVYHWDCNYDSKPEHMDRLNWGAWNAARFPVDVIRVTLGKQELPDYDIQFPLPVGGYYLHDMANTPEYHRFFSNQFSTYLLTTYTPQAFTHQWQDMNMDMEYAEYYNLAVYLGTNYPHKRFVLMNWEGNNDLAYNPAHINEYRDSLMAKNNAIRNAGMFNVVDAIELNDPNEFTLPAIIREVKPEYISYSAWKTTSPLWGSIDPDALTDAMIRDVTAINNLTNNYYDGQHFIIGEYGQHKESPMQPYIWHNAVHQAFRRLYIKYAIYWQLLEDTSDSKSLIVDNLMTDNGNAFFNFAGGRQWYPPKKK